MSRVSHGEYKELSQCAMRFGEGLGAVFNTGERESFDRFYTAFKNEASAGEKARLSVIYAMHAFSNKFLSESYFSDRVKLQHGEAVAGVLVRAFSMDKLSTTIAPSDRNENMLGLCQRAGASNLAKLIKASL